MRPGWAAGAVRGRLLSNRRLGPAEARGIAAAGSPADAVAAVATSPYGRDVEAGMGLVEAERGVQATALWHLRVLAGWMPPGTSDVVRVLAGGHEIANVEAHLDELAGGAHAAPFELGALGTAWPRLRATRSATQMRAVLASSPWGDPGSEERAPLSAALRLAWARRVGERLPELGRWAVAGAAIVVAGERFGHGRELSATAALDARRLIGPTAGAATLESLVAGLTAEARGVFAGVADGRDLWRAEAAWWRALGAGAAHEVGRVRTGRAAVAWSAVLLLADAHQVCAALEAASWGASGLETFDALA